MASIGECPRRGRPAEPPGGQLVQTRLELGVGFRELREMLRQLRRKTTRQVIHEPFQGVSGVTHASLLRRKGYR